MVKKRISVVFCLLVFCNTIYSQNKIVVQSAYCVDEALSLSKDNEVDRILCSGGCDIRLYFVININGKNEINNCLLYDNYKKGISFYAYLKGYKDTLVFTQCDWTNDDTSVLIPIYSVLPETSQPMNIKYRINDLKSRRYSKFKHKLSKRLVLFVLIGTSRYYLDFTDIDMPAYDEDKYRIKGDFCY